MWSTYKQLQIKMNIEMVQEQTLTAREIYWCCRGARPSLAGVRCWAAAARGARPGVSAWRRLGLVIEEGIMSDGW